MRYILSKLKPHWPPLKLILIGSVILLVIQYLKIKNSWTFFIEISSGILVIIGLMKWKIYFEKKEEDDPYFNDDPVYEKLWEKLLHYGSVLFVLTGFISFMIATMWTENLIREGQFILVSILGGVLLVAGIFQLVKKKFPFVFIKNATRYKELNLTGFGLGFHFVTLMALLTFFPAPVSNRLQKVAIVEHGSEKNEAFIWVDYQGKTMKLRPNRDDFRLLKGKGATTLVINKSILGFEYACEMLPE